MRTAPAFIEKTEADLRLTRRGIIAGLSALSVTQGVGARAQEQVPPVIRIVSLNWALSETLYAMHVHPIGAAEIVGYERLVGYPPTPSGMVDLGFQSEPNLELLSSLSPDVVLIQSWQSGLQSIIGRFVRVEAFTLYSRSGDPFEQARKATLRIAEIAGRPQTGVVLLKDIDQTLERCRTRLAPYDRRAIYLVQALTSTDLVVFTSNSLFDGVMRRLGLVNAWSGTPNLLWGSTRIGVDALANDPEARIIWIASPGGESAEHLFHSALWRSLPQVIGGRVGKLPMIWGFGALPTAQHFARLVTSLLLGEGEG